MFIFQEKNLHSSDQTVSRNHSRSLHLQAMAVVLTMAFAFIKPVFAGLLVINNVGSISNSSVLSAINAAITNVESLYNTGNGAGNVTLNVNFSYNGAAVGNLASSYQYFYAYSYADYTNALKSDSNANLGNTNLATAIAHLSKGNQGSMAVTYGQALLLSQYGLSGPAFIANDQINLNSNVSNWNFSGSTSSSQYDAIGSLEHEIDELLGIGGGGSTLSLCASGNSFFCGKLGSTDLYRYSSSGTPSLASSSYLSIDGGATNTVNFNNYSVNGGDSGDFGPPCSSTSGGGQNIQNGLNCQGADEVYKTTSPEYITATAIGWDTAVASPPPVSGAPVPEPSPLLILATGFTILITLRRKSENH